MYLVGWDGDRPVAGGGVRTIAPHTGEIKRMYVAPRLRGRGVARQLLAALEQASAGLGHRVVRLDTGPLQTDARHIYETSGYRPIPDYNGNPAASYWGEKDLT